MRAGTTTPVADAVADCDAPLPAFSPTAQPPSSFFGLHIAGATQVRPPLTELYHPKGPSQCCFIYTCLYAIVLCTRRAIGTRCVGD